MAEYLIKKLPIELCHHINVFNLYNHNYKLVLKDLLNTYWKEWINRFKFKSNSNIYYYFLYIYQKYNTIYNEYQYFKILLKEFKYNHIIYNNNLYHPIYEDIYKKYIQNYYISDNSQCYSHTFVSHLNE